MASTPEPAGNSGAAPLDASVLTQLLDLDDGHTGLLQEMLGLFQEDTPGRIDAIGAALGRGDLTEAADLAHAVKGAAGTMGASEVRAVAAELEGSARKSAFATEPGILVERLGQTYGEAVAALEAYIADRS